MSLNFNVRLGSDRPRAVRSTDKRSGVINKYTQVMFSLAAVWVFGCGTFGGSRQIISIDSEERGQKVYYRDGSYIGQTPLFSEVLPEPRLTLITKNGSFFNRQRFDCRFRWWESPLENAPLILIGGSIGTGVPSIGFMLGGFMSVFVGTAVDTIGGASFECPARLVLKGKKTEEVMPLRCAVRAPADLDETLRSELITNWHKSPSGKRYCADLVDADTVREKSNRLKIPNALKDMSQSDRQRVYRFGYETGAGRLVTLKRMPRRVDGGKVSGRQAKHSPDMNPSGGVETVGSADLNASRSPADLHQKPQAIEGVDTLTKHQSAASRAPVPDEGNLPNAQLTEVVAVTSTRVPFQLRERVVDLHRLTVESEAELELFVPPQLKEELSQPSFGGWIRRRFSLIPDAIGPGFGVYRLVGESHRAHSPIKTLMLGRVSHPSAFARYEVDWNLSPEFIVDFSEQKMTVYSNQEFESREDEDSGVLRMRRLGIGLLGKVEWHTPIGAVGAGLALGVLHVNASQPKTKDTALSGGMRFTYTVFMTDQLYFRLRLAPEWPDLQIDKWSFNHQFTGTFQIGLHVPFFENWLRSVF